MGFESIQNSNNELPKEDIISGNEKKASGFINSIRKNVAIAGIAGIGLGVFPAEATPAKQESRDTIVPITQKTEMDIKDSTAIIPDPNKRSSIDQMKLDEVRKSLGILSPQEEVEIFDTMKSAVMNNRLDILSQLKERFIKEKKYIIHGFVESPDKRHGAIIPDSYRDIDGQKIHTEVRRVWDIEGIYKSDDITDADYLTFVYVTEDNKAVGSEPRALKGSELYEKYFPLAMEFASELDETVFKKALDEHDLRVLERYTD